MLSMLQCSHVHYNETDVLHLAKSKISLFGKKESKFLQSSYLKKQNHLKKLSQSTISLSLIYEWTMLFIYYKFRPGGIFMFIK